jgi:hypothetical protein
MKEVKSYDFVRKYFADSETLLRSIKEYHRIANIKKGEYTLFDLLKGYNSK